jgi:transglutaminase-like putative cysteine protease
MIFKVLHRTFYQYQNLVQDNINDAHLQPRFDSGQHCFDYFLHVEPQAHISSYLDYFKNWVHHFEVMKSHDSLLIESSFKIKTVDIFRNLPIDRVSFSDLTRNYSLEYGFDFLGSSRLVPLTSDIKKIADELQNQLDDIWQVALTFNRFIYEMFHYVPESTDVGTTAQQVLEQKKGVCQDFAHLLLGLCRSVDIPARYVSGYIYSGTANRALRGAQASHAWVEVFVPGFGWLGLDPTNDQMSDERYIKVAIGRDYTDITPLRGTYRGEGDGRMRVEVYVDPIEEVPLTAQESVLKLDVNQRF